MLRDTNPMVTIEHELLNLSAADFFITSLTLYLRTHVVQSFLLSKVVS